MTETEQEMAEDRTGWAEDRTMLANERTFAGWMRTGLACIGVGLGFRALFRASEQDILAKSTACLFILIGVVIIFLAYRSSCKLLDRLDAHSVQPLPRFQLRLIATTLGIGGLLLGVIIWLL